MVDSTDQHRSDQLQVFDPPETGLLTAQKPSAVMDKAPHSRILQSRTLHGVFRQFISYARFMERKIKQTDTEMFDYMSQVMFPVCTLGPNKDNKSILADSRKQGGPWPLRGRREDGFCCA